MANDGNRHPDRLTAIASGLVALFALGVSTYNVLLQRQQIRAQVWPHLTWSYSQREVFTIQLSNEGVGPAIVKSVELSVDKQPVPDWPTAFTRLGLDIKDRSYSTIHRAVLPAGGTITAVTITNNAESDKLAESFHNRLTIDVCYCSVLDECRGLDDLPRKRCPTPAVRFTQ